MFTHLHENNKQKLNFINSFELLKHGIFIFYKFFILVFAVFAFSIAQAQTVARQHDFEKDMQELLTETPAIQTEFARQHDFEKDAVEEVEPSIEFKTELQISIEISSNSEVGFSYNHISNASLGDKNPGANSYMFNFIKKF